MNDPGLAAVRFGWGLALGLGLGLVYGFLRPLRRRHRAVPDLIFMAVAFYAWLILSFQICEGDIRIGTTAALPIGMVLFECTLGILLKPVFFLFWNVILFPIEKIVEIFLKIMKKVFAYMKKWVTIGWNNCRNRHRSGGDPHDRQRKKIQGGISPRQTSD